VVSRPLEVEHKTGKVRQSETNVPPLRHATSGQTGLAGGVEISLQNYTSTLAPFYRECKLTNKKQK